MLGRKSPERLTEREKVAERRKEVLSRGRKFKYPLQYAKHRVAIIASVISVAAVVTLFALGYFALYVAGSTNDAIYRITQVLPVPVAKVAGADVRFSDYLLFYRSSVAVLEQTTVDDIDQARLEYKRSALTSAEEYAYAEKLAQEQGISVSDEEVTALFDEQRRAGGTDRSAESFLKILSDNFGIDRGEYNRMLYLLLTKMKVSAAIDTNADTTSAEVVKLLQANGGDFTAVADRLVSSVSYEDTGGLVDVTNIDGGRADKALSLSVGTWSAPFISSNGDAYYIVKLLDKSEDGTEVSYASLKIPFTEFSKRFDSVIESGDYQEYIEITSLQNPEN